MVIFRPNNAKEFVKKSGIIDFERCPKGGSVFKFWDACPDTVKEHVAAWKAYQENTKQRRTSKMGLGALIYLAANTKEEACQLGGNKEVVKKTTAR